MSDAPTARSGPVVLQPAPDGLPDPFPQPPTVAETGDPFATLRILDLLARIERARPVRVADLVDHLNGAYLDWLFTPAVVGDAVVQLAANWMSDYRNVSGISIDEDAYGVTVTFEDSSRMDPWLVRQAQRAAAECREQLRAFSLRDRGGSGA